MAINVTSLRKLPQQERRVMVSVIVEAAAQVLERHGEQGFNTNVIAAAMPRRDRPLDAASRRLPTGG